MSIFNRKPPRAAEAFCNPAYTREQLQGIAREIALLGWAAVAPRPGTQLLIIGELQRQIDELKKETA